MRAILFTEELMGVALTFSKKSSTMGSLSVSWEDPEKPVLPTGIINRKTFRRRILTGICLCLLTLLIALILVFSVVCKLDSASVIRLNPPSSTFAPETQPRRATALQGLGTVFRRGTRSMSELLVAHVTEDVKSDELRMFLRVLHRSGLGSRADVVLLFPGDPAVSELASVVEEEDRDYQRLLSESGCLTVSPSPIASGFDESNVGNWEHLGPRCWRANPDTLLRSNSSLSMLNLEAFVRAGEESKARAESALSRALKRNNTSEQEVSRLVSALSSSRSPSSRPVPLGSIMAFDIAELDPLDTLSGFIDHPPIQVRRWLSYQMLLGMAKQHHHRYIQVLVTQVRGVLIFGDSLLALSRRHKDSRGLVLVTESKTWLEDATESPKKVSPATAGGREILSESEDSPEDPEENPETPGAKKSSRKRSRRRKRVGLIEEVYGRQVWGSIEREDKAGWEIVSSAVFAGGTRAVRTLADAVATEVARAAMMRRNRRPFSDQAAINYVVRRNANMLGRKVVDKMMFVDGAAGAAGVRVLTTPTSGGVTPGTARYDVVISNECEACREQLVRQVVDDLCSSPRESSVYSDCRQQHGQQQQQLQREES